MPATTAHLSPVCKAQPFGFRPPRRNPKGTLEWTATTLILAEARASGKIGTGFSYADGAAVRLIAISVTCCREAMVAVIRNSIALFAIGPVFTLRF
jgi:hypothetical protein